MPKKMRTFETNADVLHLSRLNPRLEREQISNLETKLQTSLESVPGTQTNLLLSRELILRLIEVLRNL